MRWWHFVALTALCTLLLNVVRSEALPLVRVVAAAIYAAICFYGGGIAARAEENDR